MRVTVWPVVVATTVFVMAAAIAAGCSSSSSAPPASVADASPEADDDGGGPNGCHVDASLTVFAESDASAAGCASCINDNCNQSVLTCASDCVCINLFTCLFDFDASTDATAAEAVNACAGKSGLSLLNNPGVRGLANCYSGPCLTPCGAVFAVDGGDDAPAEAAADESGSDSGSEAGSVLDAPNGG
jgi:hypothetical protein